MSLVEGKPRIRHPHQFEIKLRYALPEEQKRTIYDLSVYLFLPPSLGISSANYRKENFYEDLQSYIRLKTPEVSFTDIPQGGPGPLSRLNAAALRLQGDTSDRSVRLYEYQSKLFCCVLQSSLREYFARVEAAHGSAESVRLIQAFRIAASSLRSTYSALGSRLCTPAMPPSAQTMYRFTDEYISLLLDEYACRIIAVMPSEEGGAKLRAELIELVKEEVEHRKNMHYQSVAHPSGDNESFVYRRGVLKKYMNSVLFLSAYSGDGGHFLEEGLFGVAAGVSMIFATAILFVSTQLYGSYTGPVFLALVISYIFKDRIKERLRLYLSRKAARWLFDHRTTLYANPKDRIGVCNESVDFIDASMVPEPVAVVRNRTHITEIEGGWIGERAIRYRKHVKLYPVRIADIYDRASIHDVNDIMRFNIEEFVRHLGSVDKPVRTLVGDQVSLVRGDRVHHLNMILRYAANGRDAIRRYRIVLNRDGIKRIETVPNPLN
ncbi:MAG: hypothetical protein BMS9Abin14_639 [Gammaproteobacteria bacterium]|nr:MAG: hypothetical protein BMS9Abin14_639 [Gammaproteobacteria bacterium]